MKVLIIGAVNSLTGNFYDELARECSVVAVTWEKIRDDISGHVKSFSLEGKEGELEKIFTSYIFDYVICLPRRGEQQFKEHDSLKNLEQVLQMCVRRRNFRIILISSTEVYAGCEILNEPTRRISASSSGILLEATEELCQYFRQSDNLDIRICHVPYLYGMGQSDSFVYHLAAALCNNKEIVLPAERERLCDFLAEEDFRQFLLRMMDDWERDGQVFHLFGGNILSYGELEELIRQLMPDAQIVYQNPNDGIPVPVRSGLPGRSYGWVAVHDFKRDFKDVLASCESSRKKRKRGLSALWKAWKRHRNLAVAVELLVGFLLTELCNRWSGTSVQFRYVDFRLIYIVIMAMLHGMKGGLAAAILACFSCACAYMVEGIDWVIIFYNVDNWLPFAAYILLGAAIGYMIDKKNDQAVFLQEQMGTIEKKYLFLNDLYEETLEEQGTYRSQIIGYRDSFGRIFDVTRRLNKVNSDMVMKEALRILEDLLDNKSVGIYMVEGEGAFGRLVVSSKAMTSVLMMSLKLEDYAQMMNELSEGEVWCNKARHKNYPDYCAPIYNQGKLAAMIMLYRVRYEQMAVYYLNLIKVLCGLIQFSLVRAVEYYESQKEQMFIANSNIMKREYFQEALSLKESMSEENVAHYVLLRLLADTEEYSEVADIVGAKVRSNDIIGIGADGELQLLLNQVNREQLQFVKKRLDGAGLQYEEVKGW